MARLVIAALVVLQGSAAHAAPWSLSVHDDKGTPLQAMVSIMPATREDPIKLRTDADGHLLATDKSTGNALIAKLEDNFFDNAVWQIGGQRNVPAYSMAQTAPGRARVWLEWRWARTMGLHDDNSAGGKAMQITMAMCAVDVNRAMQMAASIPSVTQPDGSDDPFWRNEAQRKIAQFLMATPAVRNTLDFNRWSATDSWTPGDDSKW